MAENRQIGCVSSFLGGLSEQKTPHASKAQNHGIYEFFFASGSKNNSIYSVFGTAPSKNTGIYAVFSMLQEVIFHAKGTKNSKLQCFGIGSALRVCGGGGAEGGRSSNEQQSPESSGTWAGQTPLYFVKLNSR